MRNCKEMQTYLNEMIIFQLVLFSFFIPLSWNHLLSEQGRRFSKKDEKFKFFLCFQMLKALCHEICFWAFGEDNM